MINRMIIIAMALALIAGCTGNGTTHNESSDLNFSNESSEFMTVEQFNSANYTYGTHVIGAYVIGSYTCPPCPDNARCKPCDLNHITISDKNESVNGTLKPYELKVYYAMSDDLAVGEKYILTVQVKSAADTISDVQLTEYKTY